MRRLFLILLFAAVAAEATAQSLESFKRRLTEPRSGCRIEVHEAPAAAAAFSAASAEAASRSFNGWRINLFFSNGQHARDEAREVVTQFEESFPGLSVDMFYDNPYFKVSAGRCATAEEAIMLLERIRVKFPKAFLIREMMTASDLLEENPEPPAKDSLPVGPAVPVSGNLVPASNSTVTF